MIHKSSTGSEQAAAGGLMVGRSEMESNLGARIMTVGQYYTL